MLLDVRGLEVSLRHGSQDAQIVRDLDLQIERGEIVGLIGESGSGKSVTARSLIRLLPPTARVSGEILFEGSDVVTMDRRALVRHRSESVGFIFQDAGAHVNPVRRIGDFMTEAAIGQRGVPKAEAWRSAAAALEQVGVSEAGRRLRQYPHELSGGMLQRVMIATVLAGRPRLIIADESTTALDLVTQAEIVAILREARESRGAGILFISHDLELAAATCDRTAVMYAGTIVEEGPSAQVVGRPSHPYAAALVRARPHLDPQVHTLATIPGRSTAAFEAPAGCAFGDRCEYVQSDCRAERPRLRSLGDGSVACHHAGDLSGPSDRQTEEW